MLERSRDWVEADLQRLIADAVLENVGLDYKRAAALGMQDGTKREIAKDASAFANSAGGVLVYGIAEDNDHRPTAIDPVNPQTFSKEWLENVIISNVQPRIEGLHINPVQLTGANAGRVVYVVTVPQSLTAHQAPDHRYYKRFNFQSVPMEHYEVQDTMNRAKTPIIDVRIKCETVEASQDLHRYLFLFYLDNKGARSAHHFKAVIRFPVDLSPAAHGHPPRTQEDARGVHGEPYRAAVYQLPFNQVLHPMDTLELQGYGFAIQVEVDQRRYDFLDRVAPKIEWTVYADDMAPRQGFEPVLEYIHF